MKFYIENGEQTIILAKDNSKGKGGYLIYTNRPRRMVDSARSLRNLVNLVKDFVKAFHFSRMEGERFEEVSFGSFRNDLTVSSFGSEDNRVCLDEYR